MNQRVAVRAIVRTQEKTLFLQRATGRSSILGKYELPGGKLEYGEQPQDAIERYMKDETALTVQSSQLYNVMTYIDHDDRDLQYVFIVYLVSLKSDKKIALSANYDQYIWKKASDIQRSKLTDSSRMLLDLLQQDIVIKVDQLKSEVKNTIITDMDQLIVYSDGGSRGNPGPSAAGFVVMNTNEEVIHTGGLYLGITTNNQAEYQGVRLGLEKALELKVRKVDFRIDSLLVVNQMNGIYKIKNRELWPINERIRELVAQFDKVTFTHVRREFNQLADGMVNKILNESDA